MGGVRRDQVCEGAYRGLGEPAAAGAELSNRFYAEDVGCWWADRPSRPEWKQGQSNVFPSLSRWITHACSHTHTQEWRQLPCFVFLSRDMTRSFTSFSIKDILTGRDVRGPAGDMSTGGHGPSQPAARKLCADMRKLGDFQEEISAGVLGGSSQDTNTLSDKGEQQTDVLLLLLWSLTHLQTHSFLFSQLYFCGKKENDMMRASY